jgi:hypothetical protein
VLFEWRGTFFHDDSDAEWIRASAALIGPRLSTYEAQALAMALLHDVRHNTGGPAVADVGHVLDGYRSMHERDFEGCTRICVTHSFPIKQADAYAVRWDCLAEEQP